MLESMVSGSNFSVLNWDSPTRFPGNANPSFPDVSLASASLAAGHNSKMGLYEVPCDESLPGLGIGMTNEVF